MSSSTSLPILDLRTKQTAWSHVDILKTQKRIHATGKVFKNYPPPMNSASMVMLPESRKLAVFGGVTDVSPVNETYFFCFDSKKWNCHSPKALEQEPTPAAETSHEMTKTSLRLHSSVAMAEDHKKPLTAPPERCGHVSWVSGDSPHKMYVCCGANIQHGEYFNDLWCLDTEGVPVWTPTVPYGTGPKPRWYSSVTCFEDRAFLFGGEDPSYDVQSDLHVFSSSENSWLPLRMIYPYPPARQLHSAAAAGNKMVVIGGLGHTSGPELTDVWAFDTRSMLWKEIKPKGVGPFDLKGQKASLAGHTCVSLDPRHVIVFGGKRQSTPTSSAFLLDLVSEEWVPLVLDNEAHEFPTPRWKQCCAADPSNASIHVFGGIGVSSRFNDLWSLKFF